MLYRVLAAALVCSAPVAGLAAGLPRTENVLELDTIVPVALVAELRAQMLGGAAAPHPLDADEAHAMWDPLGFGCIDAADPAAWLPDGQRDPGAGPLCLPQPCVRLLTEEEVEQDVLGRPLAEGEWGTYTRRFSETCIVEVRWDGEDAWALDLLPEDRLDWPGLEASDQVLRRHAGIASWGARGAGAARGQASWFGPSGGAWPSDSGISAGPRRPSVVQLAQTPQPTVRPPGGFDGPPFGPGRPKGGDGGRVVAPDAPAPAPIPLPASIVLLAAALAALRLPRR